MVAMRSGRCASNLFTPEQASSLTRATPSTFTFTEQAATALVNAAGPDVVYPPKGTF